MVLPAQPEALMLQEVMAASRPAEPRAQVMKTLKT